MDYSVPIELAIFWLVGFSFSSFCFLFQIFIYILIPCSRKLDQKILTQMTIARLLNVVFEYIVCNKNFADEGMKRMRIPVFAFYMQTDAALICWMFLFTKNLYEKVINVFTLKKLSFTIVSVTIWIVTFPIGLMCPLLLTIDDNYFHVFFQSYSFFKFVILIVNMGFFGRIFYVAISRTGRSVGILRTCVVSFILLTITSVQVFVTDVLSVTGDYVPMTVLALASINSYQVIAITIIFVILVQGALQEGLVKAIRKKITRPTV